MGQSLSSANAVGLAVGLAVGDAVGLVVGDVVGLAVGDAVGLTVGDVVGFVVGDAVGLTVGLAVGSDVEQEQSSPHDLQVFRLVPPVRHASQGAPAVYPELQLVQVPALESKHPERYCVAGHVPQPARERGAG